MEARRPGPFRPRMCTDKDKPLLSRRADARSSRPERKRLGVVEPVRLFPCGITRRVRENKDRLYFNIKIYPGIIFPGRGDLSRSRGCELEAGCSAASERAPQGTACISPRGGRGSQRHKAEKARKMAASAARMIGRAACMSLDQNDNKKNFRAECYHG